MELISRISRGTLMDQIYLPKKRPAGFEPGSYVQILPVKQKKPGLFFCNATDIESIKINLIEDIFQYLREKSENIENAIITGSFLDKGFSFSDIDLIMLSENKQEHIEKELSEQFNLIFHVIQIDFMGLQKGYNTDPLFRSMMARFVSLNRISLKNSPELNYKLLDLHLLSSKTLAANFDTISGSEKLKLTRNMVAIELFMRTKKADHEKINSQIEQYFKVRIKDIKDNMLDKKKFIKKFRLKYNSVFKIILSGINGTKQK